MIGIEKTLNIGLLLGKKHLQQQQNYSSTCRRSSHAAAGKTYLQQQQHHQHQHQRQHSAAEACSSSKLHTATVRNCPRRRWQNNKYKIRQSSSSKFSPADIYTAAAPCQCLRQANRPGILWSSYLHNHQASSAVSIPQQLPR